MSGSRQVVLGLGNGCLDTVLEVERLPAPGQKEERRGLRELTGGQIASALVGCTRLGLETQMVLRTGEDRAGERIRAALRQEGVGLKFARVVGGESATAVIVRDRRGERLIVWNTPAELEVKAEEITPAMVEEAGVVFFDGRDGEACLRAARLARERGIPVVADLDCHYPHTAELLELIDHLVAPAEFELPERVSCGTVVVTRGSAGAEGWAKAEGGERVRVPGFEVEVVDTTGAGDAFHAGYIFGLLAGWGLEERMRFGNATAALSCQAAGSQAGLPRRAQVEALLARAVGQAAEARRRR